MPAPAIDVYIRSWCGYCTAATRLLDARGAAYRTVDVEAVPGAYAEMKARAGGRTSTPQVFVGETHVGGSDDLHALDRAGRLAPLLAGAGVGAGEVGAGKVGAGKVGAGK